ncbi:MAG: hypothetical protein Q7J67_05250, partial [bacterium]|nr:hypothetical protein [bacterium]
SGVSMLDNAFYTDQEKAADAGKIMDTWLKIQETTASENSIRSITRRILAWLVMGSFIFMTLSACVIWKFSSEWAGYVKTMLIDSQLGYLAMIVGFFYFGAYEVGRFIKKEK